MSSLHRSLCSSFSSLPSLSLLSPFSSLPFSSSILLSPFSSLSSPLSLLLSPFSSLPSISLSPLSLSLPPFSSLPSPLSLHLSPFTSLPSPLFLLSSFLFLRSAPGTFHSHYPKRYSRAWYCWWFECLGEHTSWWASCYVAQATADSTAIQETILRGEEWDQAVSLDVCLSICLPIQLSIRLVSVCQSSCLIIYLVCLSLGVSVCPSVFNYCKAS